jgi:NhaP-type Na+/H+ or K+/H+ antiporter
MDAVFVFIMLSSGLTGAFVDGCGTSISFASEMFLFLGLPPILFHSSLKFKMDSLRRTWLSSALFSWAGTIGSVFLIAWGIMVWTSGTRIEMSPVDALLFASILAPTDTVATISLSTAIRSDPDCGESAILEVLENESVMNDAISVVLVRLFASMNESHQQLDRWVPMEVVGLSVLYSFVAIIWGYFISTLMNRFEVKDMTVHYVVALIVYATCECVDVSGILGLFVYGSLVNVPKNVSESIGSLSLIIESSVYLMLGLALHTYDMTLFGLSLLVLLSCIVARVLMVFFLGVLLRCCGRKWWTIRSLMFFSLCGVRGAISFALCQGINDTFIKSTTFVVIVTTIVVMGSLQKCMFRLFLAPVPTAGPTNGRQLSI